MQEICRKAHERWSLKKIALAHRTGLVEIGQPSVIIAVSSAHRREALEVQQDAHSQDALDRMAPLKACCLQMLGRQCLLLPSHAPHLMGCPFC